MFTYVERLFSVEFSAAALSQKCASLGDGECVLMQNVLRYGGAVAAFLVVVACSGSSGLVSSQSPGAPRAPANYIGTYQLTYSGVTSNCDAGSLPTAFRVTGTAQGTNEDGNAVTLLAGGLLGGNVSLQPGPFANTSPAATADQPNFPAAYVVNATGEFVINVLVGHATLLGSMAVFEMQGNINAAGFAAVEVQSPSCNASGTSTIGSPS